MVSRERQSLDKLFVRNHVMGSNRSTPFRYNGLRKVMALGIVRMVIERAALAYLEVKPFHAAIATA
jgi:hypothetical protein